RERAAAGLSSVDRTVIAPHVEEVLEHAAVRLAQREAGDAIAERPERGQLPVQRGQRRARHAPVLRTGEIDVLEPAFRVADHREAEPLASFGGPGDHFALAAE